MTGVGSLLDYPPAARWARGGIVTAFASAWIVLYAGVLLAALATGLFLCCAVGWTARLVRLKDTPDPAPALAGS